ncbi:MAG: GNAT family N-acetyltransferase [Cellvibrionaceae bacterium]|nr:GNAT family N-acetyltransferase [Cellvibrionaceae bacterium]
MQCRFIPSIHKISATDWNLLCPGDYPFLRHEFLAALEDSGSTCEAAGWQPHHLLVEEADRLIGLMPLFIKTHSYGEYVFDWVWADAYQRHGLNYYPKLVNAIPFTPATGPRWGIMSGYGQEVLTQMFEAIAREAALLGLSSCHYLFPPQADCIHLDAQGLLQRTGCQYHWFNEGYGCFEDFIARFTSRKRKSLKKERQCVQAQGLSLRVCQGTDISAQQWQQFYLFYHLTYLKRSGRQGYLGESFFPLLANAMSEQLMMVQAFLDDQMVAAALYFEDATTLYGRYWGCMEEFNQLHFEACYYQGIDYAIAKGLQKFDPGAQGEHKIQRGFRPTLTYSYHQLTHQDFHGAIGQFLAREREDINHYLTLAAQRLPFKNA